jgi:ABC-type ATPase involved in cell division
MNDPTNDLNPTRLRIGGLRGTDESVHLDLTGNTYIWGQTGSGTSTLVRRILAGAAPTNRITWVIDPHNFEETRPFLTPMIDGDGPAPPFD